MKRQRLSVHRRATLCLVLVVLLVPFLWRILHLHSKALVAGTSSAISIPDAPPPIIADAQATSHANHLNTKPNSNHIDLLLSVPFYVYEELAWENATLGGIQVEQAITTTSSNNVSPSKFQKHSNDYWFMKASLKHPMRTRNPKQAKLFVIPLLLNLYSSRVYSTESIDSISLCWRGMCDRDLMKHAGRILNASSYFHSSSHLHLATTSHFGYHLKGKLKMPALLRQAIYKCHAITYERKIYNDPKRLRFSSYLVGHACPTANTTKSEKIYDAALIATLKPNDERFQDREHICEWLLSSREFSTNANAASTTSTATPMLKLPSFCGQGPQCPTLGQSKVGFHVRGDTFGSQRLMDTILSGTVPIFTRPEQYQVQPNWIDWNQLSYFIDLSLNNNNRTQQDFLQKLQAILQEEPEYQRKLKAVQDHQALFDWTTLYPFDTYMYMLQSQLYPETRHNATTNRSHWSALILPPPRP